MKMLRKVEIKRSLTKKGFKEKSSKHAKFILYVNGKVVGVQTIMSHGGGEPGKDLLHQMRRDLRFEDQSQFESFIECTYSEKDYVDNLIARGIIKNLQSGVFTIYINKVSIL